MCRNLQHYLAVFKKYFYRNLYLIFKAGKEEDLIFFIFFLQIKLSVFITILFLVFTWEVIAMMQGPSLLL
jgi:hypothetical protein